MASFTKEFTKKMDNEILNLKKQIGALYIIVVCLAFGLVLVLAASGIQKRNLEKSYNAKLIQYKKEVDSLTWEQTTAIKDLNNLTELIRPLAEHKEVQLIDYYRQKIWEYEESQKDSGE